MTVMSQAPAEQVQAKLSQALDRHLGIRDGAHQLVKVTGGATKSTWIFAAKPAQGSDVAPLQKMVLQLTSAPDANTQAKSGETSFVATKLSARSDVALLRAAHAQGVPVPPVLALLDEHDGLGNGHITGWVAGETLAPKLLREARFAHAREQLPGQCARALAQIHSIPTRSASFLEPLDAQGQWQRYRNIVDGHGVQIPALEFGLRWVEEQLPAYALSPGQASVVHGDFRLGNLIVDEQGLACVIDWELACLGDPMQDLAWLCLKTWRFGGPGVVAGMGERLAFYRAYEAASGKALDPGRVRFWEAFGQVKWAIMCLSMGLGKPGAPPGSVSLEHHLIGRRVEEPLWDLLNLLDETSP